MSRGTATEIKICRTIVRLGDFLKVEYMTRNGTEGGTIEGKVVELWSNDNHLQGRLSNGWCFHDYDKIVSHKKRIDDNLSPE